MTGRGGGEARGCTESSVSSEEQPAAGCLVPCFSRSSSPSDGSLEEEGLGCGPRPPHWHNPGRILNACGAECCALWWNFIWKDVFRNVIFVVHRNIWISGYTSMNLNMSSLNSKQAHDFFFFFGVGVFWKNSLINILMFQPSATRCHCKIDLCIIYRLVGHIQSLVRGSYDMFLLNHFR